MEASQKIDEYIAKTEGWRGESLARIRQLTREALTDVIEEWKWNSPVWSNSGGMIFSASAFKKHVNIHFFQGAALDDPDDFFNAGLDAKGMRAVKLEEGDSLDEAKFQAMLRRGAEYNAKK